VVRHRAKLVTLRPGLKPRRSGATSASAVCTGPTSEGRLLTIPELRIHRLTTLVAVGRPWTSCGQSADSQRSSIPSLVNANFTAVITRA
jgi:hypothetical protein